MKVATITPSQKRSVAFISVAAILLFIVVRNLPTGTNLSHMDFRVQGGNVIEFCDPANPQFLPVVSVRSPVTLAVSTDTPPHAGSLVNATLTLTTFSGKPIAPEDLQIVQTRPIHLMIVDASLDDYQHVHPVPGRVAGTWSFSFRPLFGGTYRIFADFTPVATNRGLYSETEMSVAGAPSTVVAGTQALAWTAVRGGYRFALTPDKSPIRARTPVVLTLTISRVAGGPVDLSPVMGAFAHMVAFDAARSGFAHIHPDQADISKSPDPYGQRLPSAWRYRRRAAT